jgi:hypothetical protein
LRFITAACVIAFNFRAVRFENLAVGGVRTERFFVWQQEVTGIAVLHGDNVTNCTKLFNALEKYDIHVFGSYFTMYGRRPM